MAQILTEQEVLKKLDIPDFRHMTKDKIISFASMIQNMDPDVAKKAIEQFPRFAEMMLDAMRDYKGYFESVINDNNESSKHCYEIYQEINTALKQCLARDDTSFEERKYYIDRMMEIARMADTKDIDTKNNNLKLLAAGSAVVLAALGIGASVLGGNTSIKLPVLHK